jgi:hypothetical protein
MELNLKTEFKNLESIESIAISLKKDVLYLSGISNTSSNSNILVVDTKDFKTIGTPIIL